MITVLLLDFTHPVWLLASLAEIAVLFFFVRGIEYRNPSMHVCDIALLGVRHVIRILRQDVFIDFVLCIAAFFVYLRIARRTNGQQALLLSGLFELAIDVGKTVCVDLIMQPMAGFFTPLGSVAITLCWIIFSLAISLVILVVASKWLHSESIARLSWGQCVTALLPLIPYVLIRQFEIDNALNTYEIYQEMMQVTLAIGLTTIISLVAVASGLTTQAEHNELLRMQALLREQHAQYLAQKEAETQIRAQYHDLKHFITEIDAITAGDQRTDNLKAYATRVREELEPLETRIETGNEVLDILLTEKRNTCIKKDIVPVFYVDAAHLGFVNDLDLCALFGNIVDNALEAASKVLLEEHPEIELDVRQIHQMSVTRCTNPYVGELLRCEDGLATTKREDTENHGYGLRSIQMVASRYNGEVVWDAQDGLFTLTVIIPLPR
ncbi:MAG: sensor histidine kinase [Coriobacteriales bacterium]|nr:sensor histidine kinase [Coriobacteriales bacterium]